jgi:predicted secreted protein
MPYTGSQAFPGQGTQLEVGDGGSPETFTTIAEIKKIQGTGAKTDILDTTNMDSIGAYREKLATLLDAGEINFDANFVPSNVTQQSLQAKFDARLKSNWKIVLPGVRGTWSFAAFIGSIDFDVPVDKEVTMSGKLIITGPRTFTPGV